MEDWLFDELNSNRAAENILNMPARPNHVVKIQLWTDTENRQVPNVITKTNY